MPPNTHPMPDHDAPLEERVPPGEEVAAVYDYLIELAKATVQKLVDEDR